MAKKTKKKSEVDGYIYRKVYHPDLYTADDLGLADEFVVKVKLVTLSLRDDGVWAEYDLVGVA